MKNIQILKFEFASNNKVRSVLQRQQTTLKHLRGALRFPKLIRLALPWKNPFPLCNPSATRNND